MRNKRFLLLLCLIFSLFLLSGCSYPHSLMISDSTPLYTASPRTVSYISPIGDATLEYTKNVQLYFPALDDYSLVAQSAVLTCQPTRPEAESIVRLLLESSATSLHDSLGGGVKLTLYGSTPVEISGDTATVHLSVTVKQLEKSRQFLVCRSITDTLCENCGINAVSFMIGERPFTLDLSELYPVGCMIRSNSTDCLTEYQQQLSTSQAYYDGKLNSITQRVLLYCPVPQSDGVIVFSDDIAFSSSSSGNTIIKILKALSSMQCTASVHSVCLPDVCEYLTAIPSIRSSDEAHGNIVDLRFDSRISEKFTLCGITEKEAALSMCLSLCTYLPNVVGIHLSIAGKPVETALLVEVSDDELPSGTTYLRKECCASVLNCCTIYLPQKNSTKIVSVCRAVPYMETGNPRSLIANLCTSALEGDSRRDTLPALNLKNVTEADILGFSIENGVLIVNFSFSFFQDHLIPDGVSEQQTVYSLVNTLCSSLSCHAVCFLQGGTWFEGYQGEIIWEGPFYPIPEAEENE